MISVRMALIALLISLSFTLSAQQSLPDHPPVITEPPPDVRLPNGKLQREEILKADFQKNVEDARTLSKLSNELKTDLEKSDYNVLPLNTLKKIDEIDRLARRIRDRLRR